MRGDRAVPGPARPDRRWRHRGAVPRRRHAGQAGRSVRRARPHASRRMPSATAPSTTCSSPTRRSTGPTARRPRHVSNTRSCCRPTSSNAWRASALSRASSRRSATATARRRARALDEARLEYAYRWDLLLEAGVPVITGSDYPIEVLSPLIGLQRLITTEPQLDIDTALRLLTDESAGTVELGDDPALGRRRRATGAERGRDSAGGVTYVLDRRPRSGERPARRRRPVALLRRAGCGAVGAVRLRRRRDPGDGGDLLRPARPRAVAGGRERGRALAALLEADDGREMRQVAIVDAAGRVAVHTGDRAIADAGHLAGEGWSVQANMMRRDGRPRGHGRRVHRGHRRSRRPHARRP